MSITPKPQGDTPHHLTPAHSSALDEYWENYPSIDTPITEDELNRVEQTVDEIDARVLNMDIWKAEQSDLLLTPKSITYEKTTGVFTITFWNGATVPIDTDIEKIAINFDYDDDPTSAHYQQLIITLDDGDPTAVPPIPATVKYVDLSALITQYEFENSNTIGFTVGQNDGSVSAEVLDGSITGQKLQPNYLADCLGAKAGAEAAEADAVAKALVSEGWAKGTQNGTPVTSSSPYYENNAEYFKNQAQSIVGSKVDSFNGRTGVVVPANNDYSQDMIGIPTGATAGQVPVVRNVGGSLKFQMEDMSLDDNDFTISTTWVANSDTGDYATYPYKQTIPTQLYSNNSSPYAIVLAGTPTNYMSSAELEDKAKLCQEIQYTSSGIILLASEPTLNALTLRVRGN